MKIFFKNKGDKKYTKVKLSEEKTTSLVIEKDEQRLVIGIGKYKGITHKHFVVLLRKIIAQARANKLTKIVVDFKQLQLKHLKLKDDEIGELLGTNFELANYAFVQFKKEPKEGWGFIEDVAVLNASKAAQKGIERGQIIGQQVNETRNLANTPAAHMTPEILVDSAKKLAKGTKVKIKALDVDDMKILGMGGVLAVGQGSDNPPRFIIADYRGAKNKKDTPIVLVGKGITFDSGGLSIKPADFMADMHHDMAGGAAALNTVILASKLGIKKNIITLVSAAENMVSGSSYHPGDLVKTMSGQTIEVLNTDAEGRVVMSDALTYAERYKPSLVIDVATLTGAAMVALGLHKTGVFTKDLKLEQKVRDIGDQVGEYMWPLPLGEEYTNEVKGTFGDWANLGKVRWGGASQAAAFLEQFAKNHKKWVHLDIAPTMTSTEGQFLAKGATGAPVRTLIRLLQQV